MKKFLSKLYDFSSSWTGTIIIVLFVIFFVAQAFVIPSGSMKNTLLVGDFLFAKKFSYGIPIPRIPWLEMRVLPDFNENDHLITDEGPKRGDIVIFRYPHNEKIHYVKRCFGIGGDEIIFTEKQTFLRPKEGDDFIKANYNKDDITTLNGKLFVKEPYKFHGIHYDKNANMFEQMIYYYNSKKLAMTPVDVKELNSVINGLPFNAFYVKVPENEYFMMGDNRDHSNDSRFWGSVKYRYIVGKPWFVYFSWDKDYKIRWERIGRFVDTLENDKQIIDSAIKEDDIDGLY
ncbi:signal peptidase I [Campylobacter pinnipediorum subsp. caledonicus]|uniref:signal peptidase I n=1 Tax=Campylobacter pinnipediorum TaxID=1965231 RepID=UPI000995C0A0|nr:signal peptidase I [Campylobacter pinnipediorum]OPA71574.1 signal peptidase I [Campylobacter pinnipediorum subsp. caledonicus]